MSSWKMPAALSTAITRLQDLLDQRLRPLFQLLFHGLLLTRERRRTCTTWFRAGGISDDYQSGYRNIAAVGRKAADMGMSVLFNIAHSPAAAGKRIKLTLDDTPSQRYGPQVEGAGLHHNPTPGPSNQPFLYGHVFVTLAWAVKHLQWGTISLPIRSELYVRQKDVPKIPSERNFQFRTKLALAVELIGWAGKMLGRLGKAIWLAVDGGYAKREVIAAARLPHSRWDKRRKHLGDADGGPRSDLALDHQHKCTNGGERWSSVR